MDTETAPDIIAVRLDSRETSLVAKAVHKTGRPHKAHARFLITAARKRTNDILKPNPDRPNTHPSK